MSASKLSAHTHDHPKNKKMDSSFSFENIYEIALSNTPDFVYLIGNDHRFIYINKSLLTTWGRTSEETVGLTFSEIGYEKWHADMHDREIDLVISTKKAIRGEIPFTGTNGKRIYDYIFAPVFDKDGEVIAISGITRDITERREAEENKKKSDERWMLALEASEFIGTWDWDLQTNLVIVDERFANLYSIDPAAAAKGVPIEEYMKSVHPDDDLLVKVTIESAIANKKGFEQQYRLIGRDNSIYWLISRAQIFFNELGEPVRFAGAVVDITQRKKVEEDLKQSQERLELALAGVNDGLWDDNILTEEIYYSSRYKTMLGYTEEEFPNTRHATTEKIHPEDLALVREEIQRALNNPDHEYKNVFRMRHKDGSYKWIMARGMIVYDEQKRPVRFIGGHTDVTEQKEAENELRESEARYRVACEIAESANLAKSEFLANMSHEIRTPMNAVIGLSHILLNTHPLTATQKEYLHTLQLSADSLLALLNDLLDISKIEARSITLEEVPFSLSELLNDVNCMMNVKTLEKGLSINNAINPELDHLKFMGDPTRIRQIIVNLYSNAVKFTDNGSISIQAESRKTDDSEIRIVSIAITDTGIGIHPSKINSIFEKFVQADTSINRKFGGSGLGLAITKTLLDIMNGNIHVESIVNQGSTFKIEIPLKTASVTYQKMDKQETAVETLRPNDVKILLVEDYPANILVAGIYLEKFGYEYEVANNGEEALKLIENKNYSLVLMDVQMPVMNGFEATSSIRKLEDELGKARLPIIGMTAHALSGDEQRCLDAGMDDYLTKPFNPDYFEKLLFKHLNKKI